MVKDNGNIIRRDMAVNKKILLIEDDDLLIRMYQNKFARDGYEVITAFSGEDGLVKIKNYQPALILLDVMLPKMNGFEVLQAVKVDPATKNIPVIMLTNLASEEDAKKGLELGAVAYLVKSEKTPDQIIAKIKEILSGYSHHEVPKAAE